MQQHDDNGSVTAFSRSATTMRASFQPNEDGT
jgi:hypothetical protein